MTERLSQILQEKGFEAPKIYAAYMMQIGGVLLQSVRLDAISARLDSISDNITLDDLRDWDACVSSIYQEIIRALKAHPNILEVKPSSSIDTNLSTSTTRGLILQQSPVKLRLNLPIAVQRYSTVYRGRTPTELFDVITSGSIFAAYTRIEDWPYYSDMAVEFRKLFMEHITSTTQYKVPRLGPTPIHPDFYIILVDQSTLAHLAPGPTPIFEVSNNVIMLVPSGLDIEQVVKNIMSSFQGPLALFYSAMVERNDLMVLTEQIHDSFRHLLSLLQRHQETKWYRLTKRVYPGAQVSTQIAHIYEDIFRAQVAKFFYDRFRRDVRDSVTAEPLLAPVTKYFVDELDNPFDLPQSLFPALEHFAEHVKSVTGTRIALVASIIGAAIGAVLTAILTR